MKKLRVLFYAVCLLFLFESNALAYIDPSIMTYTIQAVAGIVIAVGAAAGIVWRRAKKKAKQVLNIDDNAKKEVEDEIIEFEPETKN